MLLKKTIELFAKRMAGSASTDELNELENLLCADDDLGYVLNLIADMESDEEEVNSEELEAAFDRLISRMQKNNLFDDQSYERLHPED